MAKSKTNPKIADDGDQEVIIQAGGEGPVQGEKLTVPSTAAVLVVRNMVLFPGTVMPLGIGRDKSKALVSDILPDKRMLITVCQRDPEMEDPGPEDLYDVGTAGVVLKLLRMEEGQQNLILQGAKRVRIVEWLQTEPYFQARVEALSSESVEDKETEALMLNARNQAKRIIELSSNIPDEASVVINNIDEPGALADFLASNLQMDLDRRQALLEELDVNKRLRLISEQLQHQLEVLELSGRIQDQVKAKIDKSQREYFLQEQLKAIRRELGEADEGAEIDDLRERIQKAGMPEAVQEEAQRELDRMSKIPSVSPEHNVIRSYLEVMTELPWSKGSEQEVDVNRARKILDEDHYDLDKVKRRILEYLAVRKLAPESRGPILCFVGPPGVGKTSLGQSIARALGREFIRMSLGGMRDEAELRGHRRTYIGAMPGRIIQEIRKAGTNNPVFMLDELDKVGQDFRGDPTSALLEILDPAQNQNFQDHYLNVPFDLSKVIFIGTANVMATVPPALRDRMEVIELPGYTESEKLHIAQKYLVTRQLKQNGLTADQMKWKDEAVRKIISSYTREAGVRELERQIGAVCRSVAALIAAGEAKSRTANPRLVPEVLGPIKYLPELAQHTGRPGVVTGLAYTPAGGEIIFVEAAKYPGKGNLSLTGQIGDVMKESASAALSLVKSRGEKMDIDVKSLTETDIHIHVPAGAVPKDGPSAGVAMFTSLMSLLSDQAVRPKVAMTGEITLRGLVLPVGGIKEKILAAKRAGIEVVILPEANRKDTPDVPEEARKALDFVFAKTVEDVLEAAVERTSPNGRKGKRGRKGS